MYQKENTKTQSKILKGFCRKKGVDIILFSGKIYIEIYKPMAKRRKL